MGLGKASPNPLIRAESFTQSLLDGAERSLMGHYERCAIALQTQGCTSPPPAFCVSVAGPISRVPVLSAYAHKPEPSQEHPPASREAADQGTYRVYAQWGEVGLKLASMRRHCLRWCLHRSLTGWPSSWGFGLCGAPKRGQMVAAIQRALVLTPILEHPPSHIDQDGWDKEIPKHSMNHLHYDRNRR